MHNELWKRQRANLGSKWEMRKERDFGRLGNIKKIQNQELYISKESREAMDMKKHRRGNEDKQLLESNEKARRCHKVAKTINESWNRR